MVAAADWGQSMRTGLRRIVWTAVFMSSCTVAAAFDGGGGSPSWPTSGETLTVEPFVGYLRGTSTENVYDPTNKKNKISQLDWNVQAVTLGGRVAFQPFDGLTIRGRFWAAISSDADMTDRDWLLLNGYQGRDSWTHQSLHPDTRVPKAWQADVSAAYTFYDAGDLAVSGLAGFRHYNVKYRAYGGSYVYSWGAYRDTVGVFNPGQLGISYEQWWDTPYIGLGAYYRSADFGLSTEIYGSPVSFSRDKDYHALRYTLFTQNYSPLGMVGANIGLEYRITPMLSLAGRLDYTKYMEQKGGTKMYDFASAQFHRFPKPSAGAEADTLHLSLGVKGKI
jgi:outer membrane protease